MTKTKQFGTFTTKCPPIVDELESSSTNPGMLPFSFATSVLRGLRRTLEEVAGAIDSTEAGPTVEEGCPVQKRASEPGQVSYDEVTGLALDPKLVADAIKEASYPDMSLFELSCHVRDTVTICATLGPCRAHGDAKWVRILTRIVRWVKPPYGSGRELIECEADPFITKCVYAE